MTDFLTTIQKHKELSEEKQKQAGQAAGSDMDVKHKEFLANLIALIDAHTVDPHMPQTLVKMDKYDALDEISQSKVDAALVNLADQIRQIEWFFRSKTTPNASPELQTMIEHLWQMQERITQAYGGVLKF